MIYPQMALNLGKWCLNSDFSWMLIMENDGKWWNMLEIHQLWSFLRPYIVTSWWATQLYHGPRSASWRSRRCRRTWCGGRWDWRRASRGSRGASASRREAAHGEDPILELTGEIRVTGMWLALCGEIIQENGGVLGPRGTPQNYPNFNGIVPNINHPAIKGYPAIENGHRNSWFAQ